MDLIGMMELQMVVDLLICDLKSAESNPQLLKYIQALLWEIQKMSTAVGISYKK